MSFTRYASLEANILDVKGSKTHRVASLDKLSDFEDYRTEDGYLYARIRAISSRVNKNHDGWPSVELAGGPEIFERHTASEGFTVEASKSRKYGFSTFLGKPIFVDHHNSDPSRARGVIVDSKFHVDDHKTAALDPYYASTDCDPEHKPASWVELLLEVDAKAFPRLARAIIEGSRNPDKGIDGFSMGCDVERSVCNICKNSATAPDEFCNHIRMKGAHCDYHDPETGHKTSRRSYENCYGIKFFEISAVFDPADETALTREVRSSSAEQSDVCSKCGRIIGDKEICPGCGNVRDTSHTSSSAHQAALPCPHCDGKGCEECDGKGSVIPNVYVEEGRSGSHQSTSSDPQTPNFGPPRQGSVTSAEIPTDAAVPPGSMARGQYHGDPHPNAPGWQWDSNQARYVQQSQFQANPLAMKPPMLTQAPGGGINAYPVQNPTQRSDSLQQFGSVHLAENPLPQYEQPHAPTPIDTLREEKICPVCGSTMDEETCSVCNYTEPPDGFGNPDLEKAQEGDLDMEKAQDQGQDGVDVGGPPGATAQPSPDSGPSNPGIVSHVTGDMPWEISVNSRVAGRINTTETPAIAGSGPSTDEPNDKVLSDQAAPVTSSVRTASDFIAAAGRNKETTMSDRRVAAEPIPGAENQSGSTRDHDETRVDVTGVGGVQEASNEEASKADSQVDVLGKGGTGEESVEPDKTINVDQGDEHSKNIESIPTKTFPNDGQKSPVTNEVFEGNGKNSSWQITALDAGPYPQHEDSAAGDGGAAQGTQPADPVGKADDRVNLLDPTTSPENNSGATKTWSGTDGNGVTKQQDPVTNDSIAQGESGMHNSSHVFTAFKLADLEIELGLTDEDKKYERAAELEKTDPAIVEASLKYAQRVKTASRRKVAASRLPVMGQGHNPSPRTASTEPAPTTESESIDPDFALGA